MAVVLSSSPILTGCSDNAEARIAQRIVRVVDIEGGNLELKGLASLEVPAGALAEPTQLEMSELSKSGASSLAALPSGVEARSSMLELRPHGLKFEKEAPLTMGYDVDAVRSPTSLVVVRLDDPQDETWEPVPGADFTEGVAQFSISGFSFYLVAEDTSGFFSEPMGMGGAPGTGGASASGGSTSMGGETQMGVPAEYQQGPFIGFIRAEARDTASIDSESTDGLPACVTGDVPAIGTNQDLVLQLSLNEPTEGELGTYTPNLDESLLIETSLLPVDTPSGLRLQAIDENMVAWRRDPDMIGQDSPSTLAWSDFSSGGDTPIFYDGTPLVYLELAIGAGDIQSLENQQMCVHDLGLMQ